MKLDERGKQCPRPVIDTKKALESCNPGETVEVLVDNEIAVQNLSKMAASKGLSAVSEKISDNEFSVKIAVGQGVTPVSGVADDSGEEPVACQPDSRKKGMTVVLSSNLMGHGDPELGKALMKGFVYALTQQDALPETILLYNSGAYLSCEGSDNLEDLKSLESQGVEILTCGTCLNFYGLSEKLQVGSVTNMYEIVERMTAAKLLVRP
ncbi:sulfurtransferase-like selenium metabolism protein YedF [Enterocloster clostridioformis]|uniref:sulfurtransferase-like selenium metabolism protein YedF n=1 Tax=Enterocloster clostridioformis TaxID=1531 RepID=UPI00080C8822|nr:sulfurtransferase-like selenium metabolism protein YedF [Enterocloster clostridioformis]ANU45427.1 response regulator SirA [Lachnoclostridium sp. YL32]NDO32257.1 sulfurtransferase-like selenium metabolism protein YedF [Enterocloster clostridioformis]OXE63294.1 sulfurtransferase-like selenium metabolism protein YedF [Enterocloster clostridioformis]QQQ99809.1 sulfurtransferase-like selenium metabolism protein YedF [Enterocloster clostridioformis]